MTIKPAERSIWNLKDIAEGGGDGLKSLNELFISKGEKIAKLPEGYAAGTAARVLTATQPKWPLGGVTGLDIATRAIDFIVGEHWRGKYFCKGDGTSCEGKNRIRESLLLDDSQLVQMGRFDCQLLMREEVKKDQNASRLAHEVKNGSVITLNYADPYSRPYLLEIALALVLPVYDVMVAVEGPTEHEFVYIGKSWRGSYDGTCFTPANQDEILAWFFLDFSPKALKEQRDDHWDKNLIWDGPALAAAPETFIIYFAWDNDVVDAAGSRVIDDAVAVADQYGIAEIEINGHADRSGPEDYNLDLSLRRAYNVSVELRARGFEGGISFAGRGEAELAVPTDDGVREPANRRVEIILL